MAVIYSNNQRNKFEDFVTIHCGKKHDHFYLEVQSVPCSKHTPSKLQKTNQFMLYKEIIAVCSQICLI